MSKQRANLPTTKPLSQRKIEAAPVEVGKRALRVRDLPVPASTPGPLPVAEPFDLHGTVGRARRAEAQAKFLRDALEAVKENAPTRPRFVVTLEVPKKRATNDEFVITLDPPRPAAGEYLFVTGRTARNGGGVK